MEKYIFSIPYYPAEILKVVKKREINYSKTTKIPVILNDKEIGIIFMNKNKWSAFVYTDETKIKENIDYLHNCYLNKKSTGIYYSIILPAINKVYENKVLIGLKNNRDVTLDIIRNQVYALHHFLHTF